MKIGVLIPVYQPDQKLIGLLKALSEAGFETIVVDDGSSENREIFADASSLRGVTLLTHDTNRGKGRALKTGLEYMEKRGFDAAVTADADGQHTPEDIAKIAAELEKHPDALVTGMRDVSEMPPRSKTGNSLTRFLFKLLYGIKMQDTQTGLRGIPIKGRIKGLLGLDGERYEYEMKMLTDSGRLFEGGIVEVPVETVYIDGNKSSHFRPLKDGMKIYSVLFRNFPKFVFSSLTSMLIDYGLFNLFFYGISAKLSLRSGGEALLMGFSVVAARLISAGYNFLINKKFVFRAEGSDFTALRYAGLAVFILAADVACMEIAVPLLRIKPYIAKILVDAALYVLSFAVQQKWASGRKAQ